MNGNNIVTITHIYWEVNSFMEKNEKSDISKKTATYSIGLDIGTNSVGYAVIDENNQLLTFRRKNMWGVRLFDEGQSAADRRIKRSTRRRYNRRRERIRFLQEIFAPSILSIDNDFFRRMQEGYLYLEDKSVHSKNILFSDLGYTDKHFHDTYKTIYHLRKHLMESNKKEDIRLIYLALHHMIKYRGHFLFEGQKFDLAESDIQVYLQELLLEIKEQCGMESHIDREALGEIENILKNFTLAKKLKQEKICAILVSGGMNKKYASEIVKSFLGYVCNFASLFVCEDLLDDSGKELKLSISDAKYEEKETEIFDKLQEKSYILELIKKIYSWYTLQDVLQGERTLSDAMVRKYNKHQTDLVLLKKLVREYKPEFYSMFFRKEYDGKGDYLKNYYNYVAGAKRCDRDELYKEITKIFKGINDKRLLSIEADMTEGKFLPLQTSKDNSAIPYQLHLLEMQMIIEKQGEYYPYLTLEKEKIASILTFKIPYYIGPMNRNSKFAWIERSDEKIYPWNFKEVVNVDESAEKFITRMTNTCTYLQGEEVIPRYSLLYCKYLLLDELNKIRINDHLIDKVDKEGIIKELFLRKKVVKEKDLISYLHRHNYIKIMNKPYEIKGYHKEKEFAASLTSWIDFQRILGSVDERNFMMVEQIIYWLTVFEEKDIIKRKIRQNYPVNIISEAQLEQITKLRYQGWSRLSKKLLDGITVLGNGYEKSTIMDILENTNMNFMQIINDKKLGFAKVIDEVNKKAISQDIAIEDIQALQGSPAIKRGIWQTVQVVQEIIEIMGYAPENIYLEFARNEGKKERTSSRLSMLKRCYNQLEEEQDVYDKSVAKNLLNKKFTDKIDSERLFLYFIQNGKCMYSGHPLNIEDLSLYQVDHIIPRAFIKDDSIENKALVFGSVNQYKGDKLLLDAKIRDKQKYVWAKLYKCGLIGSKKYNNLLRNDITEHEAKGFINRQLVETRQISKHVAILFKEYYSNSNVSVIKAELSHDFREKYGLAKCRELNDFHHAHDAYISALLGNYIMTSFPSLEDEIIYKNFRRYIINAKNDRSNDFGYVLNKFDKIQTNSDGVIIWDGSGTLGYVRKIFAYKDCRISRKIEELTGAFYKETINRKGTAEAKIQIKKGLDTEKYGGYSGQQNAYFVVVEYLKKKKHIKKLIGIPLYISVLEKQQPNVIKEYLCKELNVNDVEIVKNRIMKYQLIEYKGYYLYLVSDREVINAKQLCFGVEEQRYVILLADLLSGKKRLQETEESLSLLDSFYEFLRDKLVGQYDYFKSTVDKIFSTIDFRSLEIKDKEIVLREILKLSAANAQYPNLKNYKLADRMGRKSGFNMDVDNTYFIDTSVTGLYERRYKI